jgi:hypothetical protein
MSTYRTVWELNFSTFCTASCPSILPAIVLHADIIRFSPTLWLFLSWTMSSATCFLSLFTESDI